MYYLLLYQNKIEYTHVGDQSLSPRLPAWSLALMMSMTSGKCPQALPLHHELHVLKATPKKVASGIVTAF